MDRRSFSAMAGTTLAVAATARLATAQQRTKRRVLVVVSSAQTLELRDGKTYQTGFFLNEVAAPVQAMLAAGYEPVFANPAGNVATWDPHSAAPIYFGGSAERLDTARHFVAGLEGLRTPRTLAAIRADGIDDYVAMVVPGGHAAMQDLPTDADLGALLRAFHAAGKVTGLICHGPTALLSALPDPVAFVTALANGDIAVAQRLGQGWIYAGYHMTAFTTSEERLAEVRLLRGQVRYYPTEALAQAGGRVVSGPDRRSLTVRDRELVTGQQPFSDVEFATAFIHALDDRRTSN